MPFPSDEPDSLPSFTLHRCGKLRNRDVCIRRRRECLGPILARRVIGPVLASRPGGAWGLRRWAIERANGRRGEGATAPRPAPTFGGYPPARRGGTCTD